MPHACEWVDPHLALEVVSVPVRLEVFAMRGSGSKPHAARHAREQHPRWQRRTFTRLGASPGLRWLRHLRQAEWCVVGERG
jgi:hypothetical protein